MNDLMNIFELLKNKNKQYLITKREIDTIYYLVKKPKSQKFEEFYNIDLAADEIKEVKENFFYCTRFLSTGETENFYLKKIEINKNDFLKFLQNAAKDENELNFVLEEFEENEIYLVIADRSFIKDENTFMEDTTLFPFLDFF